MLLNRFFLVILFTSFFVGCTPKYSSTPMPTKFETSEQQVLQAASHWETINADVSESFVKDIKSKISKSERILIKPENSVYSSQLYYDLIKHLTMDGYKVVKYDLQKQENKPMFLDEKVSAPIHFDVLLEIKTQLLSLNRGQRNPTEFSGVLSSIATGAWALKAIDTTNLGRVTGLFYGVDALDYFYGNKFLGTPPKTEIIIDLVSSRSDEYVSVSKGIYYVVDTDLEMYRALKSSNLREFKIVGETK